jgi:hypothetical protein
MIAAARIEHNCRIVVLAALYFVEILSGTDTFFAKIFLGVGHNIPLRCQSATLPEGSGKPDRHALAEVI